MPQKPKTAAEYQEEMMRLYRHAHPETTSEHISPNTSSPPKKETHIPQSPAQSVSSANDTDIRPILEHNSSINSSILFSDERNQTTNSTLQQSSNAVSSTSSPEEADQIENPALQQSPNIGSLTSSPEEADQIENPALQESPNIGFPTSSPEEADQTTPPIISEESTLPLLELEPPLPEEIIRDPSTSAIGFLKVIARTGNDAIPLQNVTVTITSRNGTETKLHFVTTTNESGETERISLPAPSPVDPQQQNAALLYTTYDVNVYHPDYFRMESRDLPIFPGITSLQKFDMIPLPQFSNGNEPTTVFENTEPRLID